MNLAVLVVDTNYITISPSSIEAFKTATLLKTLNVNALIMGEVGVGKKSLARYILPDAPILNASNFDELLTTLRSVHEIIITDLENSPNIKKILDMVTNGTITHEEGEKLIEALYKKDDETKINTKKSTLRIRVDTKGKDTDKRATVNVNIPLILAKKVSGLMHFIPKDAKKDLEEQGINLDSFDLVELIEMFERGEIEEDLVNIDADDDDQVAKVRIYVD